MNELVAPFRSKGEESVTRVQFPADETQFNTNWDELLTALYSGGSSRLDSVDVAPRLFVLFASKISDQALRPEWRRIAIQNLTSKELDLPRFWRAKRGIHRQLTGLRTC